MNLEKLNKINRVSNLELELNKLLAEEYIAWFQYYSISKSLTGPFKEEVEKFFVETADDELNDHAEKLLKRISQLNFRCLIVTPESWNCFADNKYIFEGNTTDRVLSLNLEAEIKAIEHYKRVKQLALDLSDAETASLIEEIIQDEEKHKTDIETLLIKFN